MREEVPFTFDDMHAGTGAVPEVLPGAPGHIRCIRERRFKYARYMDSEGRHPNEHEMYDSEADPLEPGEPRPSRPPALRRSRGGR
ncbi:MAG: hypothetical protein U0R24_10090 [Solirubrobacterales bacterium]